MSRELLLPWVRVGIGYARNEFGVGINMMLLREAISFELKVGPFYVYAEVDGQR